MNENGYTLIEILIAVTITGIILSAVFMFLHQGLFTWENVGNRGEWEQNWRVFDRRIKDDIHNIYYSPLYGENIFEAKYQSIKFLINKNGILKEVSYTVDFYSKNLVRKVKPCLLDISYSGGSSLNPEGLNRINDIEEETLNFFNDLDLYSVNFYYFNQENKSWSQFWEEDFLPSLIRINIDRETSDGKLLELPQVVAQIPISREYERGASIYE